MSLHSHYVATGYIYDQETARFLLIQHRKLGKWLAPGGHLEEGEQPHVGALREVWEEIGREGRIIQVLDTPQVSTSSVPQLPAPFCILAETIPAGTHDKEHIHIDFIYVITIDPAETLHLSDSEVTRAQWFTVEEIDQLDTYENVQSVCRAIYRSTRHIRPDTI
jgi:8-oxo-dGTP pyrophosphatase MutT (NUDIX family)